MNVYIGVGRIATKLVISSPDTSILLLCPKVKAFLFKAKFNPDVSIPMRQPLSRHPCKFSTSTIHNGPVPREKYVELF